MKKNYVCKNCGQEVTQDPDEVSEGYFGACLNCDEDFYEFEVIEKVYNNQSNQFADWTTKKLKDEAKGYHQAIHEHECYGSSDLQMYDGILRELSNRGIEPKTSLTF